MRNRFMRVIVFFDLPVISSADRRNYRKFRKVLINEGFIMMQESVYSKLAMNNSVAMLVKNKLRKSVPADGLIQILTITEKQYASIENLIGANESNVINNTDRIIVL